MTESAELLPICATRACGLVARPGQALCDDHAVQQRVLAAQRALAEAAPMAAEQLIDLCENAPQEDVRRRAAEAILDRVGVRPGVELQVTATDEPGPSPADVLRQRLDRLKGREISPANVVAQVREASPTE